MHAFRFSTASPARDPLPGLCLVICLTCLLVAGYLTLAARAGASGHAVRTLSERADRLERQFDSDLAVFDLALKAAAREPPGPGRLPVLDHPLTAHHAAFINRLNDLGDVTADSRPNPPHQQNFAARDYFAWHRQTAADGLFVGHSFGPKADLGATMIPISRRLVAPDGGFAGVIVAGIRLAWLRGLLADSFPGQPATATIRRADGQILMRVPFNSDDIGRTDPSDAAWLNWTQTHVSFAETASGLWLVRPIGGPAGLLLELSIPRGAIGPGPEVWVIPLLTALPCGCVMILAAMIRRARRRTAQVEDGARNAAAERMRLLVSMSHELRTPLTGIIGQAELLRQETGLSGSHTERLDWMIEMGAAMRVIVNRVIDFARPGDHTVEPVLANCDLDNLLRTCRAVVEAGAAAKSLTLTAIVDPSTPRLAKLDRVLVFEVLTNQLRNAVKYTDHGSVTLRLSGGLDGLRFEVADTGRGIAPSLRGRLFQPYDRLDAGGGEGNGLGLSITREIVARLGGRTGYRDNPGGGSVFWAELPYIPPDERPPPAAASPPSRAPLRILVADDQPVTRTVTAGYLRSAGHAVIEADSGEAALDALRREPFQVLLTDMRMPGWDGLETARRVRALPGGRGTIPIVLVTADLAAQTLGVTSDARIDLCLMKPFTRSELLEAVDAVTALVPPDDPLPVLDRALLEELAATMGRDKVDGNLRTARQRIEAFLRQPGDPDGGDRETTMHDLTGIAGALGLSELSGCLRRADPALPGGGAPSREAASRALAAIARYLERPGEPPDSQIGTRSPVVNLSGR